MKIATYEIQGAFQCDSCAHEYATAQIVFPDNATFLVCASCAAVARFLADQEQAR